MCSGITKNIIKHYEPILYELIFVFQIMHILLVFILHFLPYTYLCLISRTYFFQKNAIPIECIIYMI